MATDFHVPLNRLPFFVYDSAQSAFVEINNFTGSVYILGQSFADQTFEILYKIPCATLILNYPDPIYADVPSYINPESLDIVMLLVPTALSDNQVLTQMNALSIV